MLQETQHIQTASLKDALRSYQSLFAEQIYESGRPTDDQNPLRQEYQDVLGDEGIKEAEAPVIKSFEADCQRYRESYINELYSVGRVNKAKMEAQQQEFRLGDSVTKQLVKQIRQDFRQACETYRASYVSNLREDGQIDADALKKEQEKWGLGVSIVQAIASTEQLTFASDKKNYYEIAEQTIHRYGVFDSEELWSHQQSCQFGSPLLNHIHQELDAKFQSHQQDYQQTFLALLQEKGCISNEDRATLEELRQSLGNLSASLMAEFEQTAFQAHEQNVFRYTEEAKDVIQQFSEGNFDHQTDEEKSALEALQHWYRISAAIAAPIEVAVRLELKAVSSEEEKASIDSDEAQGRTEVQTTDAQAMEVQPTDIQPTEVHGAEAIDTQDVKASDFQEAIADPWEEDDTDSSTDFNVDSNVDSNDSNTEAILAAATELDAKDQAEAGLGDDSHLLETETTDKLPALNETISPSTNNEIAVEVPHSTGGGKEAGVSDNIDSLNSTVTVTPDVTADVIADVTPDGNADAVEKIDPLDNTSNVTEHAGTDVLEEGHDSNKVVETAEGLEAEALDNSNDIPNTAGVVTVADAADAADNPSHTPGMVERHHHPSQLDKSGLNHRLMAFGAALVTSVLILGGVIASSQKQRPQPSSSTDSVEVPLTQNTPPSLQN